VASCNANGSSRLTNTLARSLAWTLALILPMLTTACSKPHHSEANSEESLLAQLVFPDDQLPRGCTISPITKDVERWKKVGNPGVTADPDIIGTICREGGFSKDDISSVRCMLFAFYKEKSDLGITGWRLSSPDSAKMFYAKLSAKLGRDHDRVRSWIHDDYVLIVWREPGTSDACFEELEKRVEDVLGMRLRKGSEERLSESTPKNSPRADTLDKLLRMLHDHDSKVRDRARKGLVRLGGAAAPSLAALIRDTTENVNVRVDAQKALSEIGLPAISAILPLANERDQSIWNLIVFSLREMGPEATPRLIELLAEEYDHDRLRLIALVLPDKGPAAKRAIPSLLKATKNEDCGVRWTATSSLGLIAKGDKRVVSSLVDRLEDDNFNVRAAAATALSRVGPVARESLPALVRHLQDKSSDVRIGSLLAIDALGATNEALVEIRRLLHDESRVVRQFAEDTLKRNHL
jgi:HEAT repeat protein